MRIIGGSCQNLPIVVVAKNPVRPIRLHACSMRRTSRRSCLVSHPRSFIMSFESADSKRVRG